MRDTLLWEAHAHGSCEIYVKQLGSLLTRVVSA